MAPPGGRVYYFEYVNNPGSHLLATADAPVSNLVDKAITKTLNCLCFQGATLVLSPDPNNRTIVRLEQLTNLYMWVINKLHGGCVK